MKNRMKALLLDSTGQGVLELALALPMLVLILVSAAEFARFAYAGIEVSNAAHAGAAYGSQNHIKAGDTTGITNAAKSDALDLPGLNASVNRSCQCSDGTASTCAVADCSTSRIIEFVQVNTNATVSPIFRWFWSAQTMSASATMRVVQ